MNEKTLTVTVSRIELCDLMLACVSTIIRLELDGKTTTQWQNLHDKLKATLDAFDAEQDK